MGTPVPGRAKTSNHVLPWVQALRALAALSVAFLHIAHDNTANGGDPAGWFAAAVKYMPWDAGVDIFFVISGFVIVHASAPVFATAGAPLVFLRRRLARIVPLYWIMTTAFLLVLAGGGAIRGNIGGPADLAASYLFIPWPRPDGVMQPALGLGWTLNYEMLFYLIFTPFLRLRRNRAVIGVGCVLGALVAFEPFLAPLSPQLRYWSDPIILEFLFGMEIALLAGAGIRLSPPMRVVLVLVSLAVFHLNAAGVGARPVIYGLPAAALVAAAVLGRSKAAPNRTETVLVKLGDASYAMYLVHPFIMRGCGILWHKFHAANEVAGTIYVLAGLLVAQAVALVINMTVERKLHGLLRRRGRVNEAF